MDEERTYTLYMHTNIANSKRYVGITKQNVYKRWKLGIGYQHSVRFYNAIKKYGWDGFEHYIVAESLTREEACNLERMLIKDFQTQDRMFGYNIEEGGSAPSLSEETKRKISEKQKGVPRPYMLGYVPSEETRRKVSAAQKGVPRPKWRGANSARSKPVFCDELGKWYVSLREAADNTGVNYKSISMCVTGVYQTAGGYHWHYATLNEKPDGHPERE